MSKKQANFITFKEAVERKIIKEGDKVNINALYQNDGKEAILYPGETGCEEKQIISREKELNFFFANDEEGIPTFWGDTTSTRIFLEGEQGAENGMAVINKACQAWSNLKSGLKARATEARDIYHLKKEEITKERLNEYRETALLGSACVSAYTSNTFFGVNLVYGGSSVDSYDFFSSNGYVNYDSYGIRPAVSVYLPSKILVDIQKSKETGIWQLIPNE